MQKEYNMSRAVVALYRIGIGLFFFLLPMRKKNHHAKILVHFSFSIVCDDQRKRKKDMYTHQVSSTTNMQSSYNFIDSHERRNQYESFFSIMKL